MCKQKLAIAVIALLSFLPNEGMGQNDSTVAFVAYWNNGDVRDFQITKEEKRLKGDEVIKDISTTYSARFEVIDSTETSYTIQYDFKNQAFGANQIPDEFMPVLEKYKFLKIKYKTDELGAFVELLNWQEIANLMTELFEETSTMIGPDSVDISKAIEPFVKIFSTREAIEIVLLKELQYIHWPFGLEYNIYDTIHYEEYLPNLFGGDPIRADGTLTFDSVNFETSYCRFTNQLVMNPVEAKAMVVNLLDQMLENMTFQTEEKKSKKVKEMEDAFSKMSMNITDKNVFEYDYFPGWPRRINIQRATVIETVEGKVEKFDTLIIEAKDD